MGHEEDSFRPTFDELLHEFSLLYQQEWATYREVFVEQESDFTGESPIDIPSENELYSNRVRAFSAADFLDNSLYQVQVDDSSDTVSNVDSYRVAQPLVIN